MPKIVVLLQYYLPGFKSGGPVQSIDGLVSHLGSEYDLKVGAYDRDSGDRNPYSDLNISCWNRVDGQSIWYIPKDYRRWLGIASFLRQETFDVLYLQSLFNPCFSLWPLLLRRLGLLKGRTKVLLAPRGELSKGALSIRSRKKRYCLQLMRLLGLCRGVDWQATSAEEAEQIKASGLAVACRRDEKARIFLAPNLKRFQELSKIALPKRNSCKTLRVVFLSRIAPKKNLDYALSVLATVRTDVKFTIHGPIDRDPEYWTMCQSLMHELPANVCVEYLGPITPDQVRRMFSEQDLLFLATRGENFGHVIMESLLAGCPVLISDQTPWHGLVQLNAGWDVSLDEPDDFRDAIERYSRLPEDERMKMREAARCAGTAFLDLESTVSATRKMLTIACQETPSK
jgi:glycosyltransferase involved in cell wall biosynthesis